jgi:hypothetical protein
MQTIFKKMRRKRSPTPSYHERNYQAAPSNGWPHDLAHRTIRACRGKRRFPGDNLRWEAMARRHGCPHFCHAFVKIVNRIKRIA